MSQQQPTANTGGMNSVQAGTGHGAHPTDIHPQAPQQRPQLSAYLRRAQTALAKGIEQVAVVLRLRKPAETQEQQAVTAPAVVNDSPDPWPQSGLAFFGGRPLHGKQWLIEQRLGDSLLIQDCTDGVIVIQLSQHAGTGQPSVQDSTHSNAPISQVERAILAARAPHTTTSKTKQEGQT